MFIYYFFGVVSVSISESTADNFLRLCCGCVTVVGVQVLADSMNRRFSMVNRSTLKKLSKFQAQPVVFPAPSL